MSQSLKEMLPILIPGLAVTAIGAHLAWSFGRDLHFGRASRYWREAKGRIVDEDTYVASLGRGGSLAESAFTYTYTVNGVEYTSNRYDFAGRNAKLGYGRGLPTLSIGEHIPVWYDPFEPRRAVLVQGVLFGNYLRMFVATVFLFFGLLLLGTLSDVEQSLPTSHAGDAPKRSRTLTSAEVDSLRNLPRIVDTFIATPTHLELKVGDTLRMSALRVEARDSTGHTVHWRDMVLSVTPTPFMRQIGPFYEAVAPGHTKLIIEDRPRDLPTDTIPKRPFTRVDVDIRR